MNEQIIQDHFQLKIHFISNSADLTEKRHQDRPMLRRKKKKKMLKSIKGNNKDTFFLDSEKNIKRVTLKQSKQTFFNVTYDKHEKN